MRQRLALQRTFSAVQDPAMSPGRTGYPYADDSLFRSLSRSGENFRWEQLFEHRVVVVHGEAWVGKTFELKTELTDFGKPGARHFFVPLSLALEEKTLAEYFDEQPNTLRDQAPDALAKQLAGEFTLRQALLRYQEGITPAKRDALAEPYPACAVCWPILWSIPE